MSRYGSIRSTAVEVLADREKTVAREVGSGNTSPEVAGGRTLQKPPRPPRDTFPDNGAGVAEDGRSSPAAFGEGPGVGTVHPATARAGARSFAVAAPAYNEGLVIGSVVLLAKKHADRVIVVDDGSADRTAAIARLAGADVIEMPENGGKAKAMMAGFARARELGYEAVVMLDGDGQHDPEEIPIVAAPVLAGVADLVIGSRFLETRAEIPAYRRAGQMVLNGFTNLSVDGNFSTTDSQSGFRALSRRALENLTFSSEGYNIESDMIAHFAPLNLRMTEVPISVTYDVPHKHKKNPLSHGFGVLAKIVELIGNRRPLLFFGIPGGLIVLFGLGLEIYTFSELYRTNQFHYVLFPLGITALILGLSLIESGLILNFLTAMEQRRMKRDA
ncbi:glycosyltransferase family 2 protein [Methanoculleus sp. UBA208]|uniref:glycosyltransferase family 2 protein n=1 Tax=Methanoculleus sp. UBA208 TaxID=1915494 RepID=UPI0025D1F988|nr:glycosyltransferase family 2 protein [Methanoculleus sp. UBA208]